MAAFPISFKATNFRYRDLLFGGIGVLFFFVLGYYLKETQQYALSYREQQQLFLFDWTYISDILRQPGGFSVLIARFLVQFFYSLWAGVIVTSFLLTLISLLIWLVIRKIGNYWFLFPVCFVSCLFLAVSLLDNCYHYEGITAYFLMLLFLFVYSAFSFRENKWFRLAAGCVFVVALFYAAGAVALLFAICAFLYDCLMRRENALLSFLYIVLALAVGFVTVQLGLAGLYVYVYTPLGYYETTVVAPLVHYAGWLALPVCLLVAGIVRFIEKGSRYSQIAIGLIVAVIGFVCFQRNYQDNMKSDLNDFYRYEYYTVNERWDELLKASARHIRNHNDANYLNLSLVQKGELAGHLFRYPQFGPKSLIHIPKDKTPDVRLAHVLFAMGNMGAAQNVAFNASLALNGYNPTMLKMVLQIDLMRGAYAVALKYIELLEKTWHYSEWATAQRKFLFDDRAIEQDAVLGTGRRNFPNEEAFVLFSSPMDDLYKILDTNPADGKAMQYALSYLLLAKDINHIKEFIDKYYGTPGLKTLPVPAQEALIFYSDYYHTLDEDYAVQHGMTKEQLLNYQSVDLDYCKDHGVTQETIGRFAIFKEAYGKARQSADALAVYKNTFWYYLLFAQI